MEKDKELDPRRTHKWTNIVCLLLITGWTFSARSPGMIWSDYREYGPYVSHADCERVRKSMTGFRHITPCGEIILLPCPKQVGAFPRCGEER